jgi:signal transduction histidine kinase
VKAYRTSVKIKLGLIVAAVLIAVASLWYTNALANRLMRQERAAIQLWARAQEYVTQVDAVNPFQEELMRLEGLLEEGALPGDRRAVDSLRQALRWARSMPASDEINFVFNEIVEPQTRFNVPAIITDTSLTTVITSRNVAVDSSQSQEAIDADLLRTAAAYDAIHPPIRLDLGGGLDIQLIHYGESATVRSLRWFPFWQFLFVGLFILVGYLGFSYVRRSEQSSLWVGMAKEAAHQLGTPISSIMGWIELLRVGGAVDNEQLAEELEKDVGRLHRVADRFQKIGSVPTLEPQPLAPVVEGIADYVRRRMPSVGRRVQLAVDVSPDLRVAVNRELFEWVVENLLKNALDAIEGSGEIQVRAYRTTPRTGRQGTVTLDVSDTGRGIERSAARHIFRPGFSTKKRGWGLGLSLAKRIVEDYHGGTLGLAESKPGQGTTFRIVLAEAEPAPRSDTAEPARVVGARVG